MEEAHKYALASVKANKDRLYLNPVINPRAYVPDELYQIRDWKDEYNVRMLKLHPSMHNYYLPTYSPFPGEDSKKMIYPVFELAAELDIPIMLHQGETPYSMPCQIAPGRRGVPAREHPRGAFRCQQHPGHGERCDPAGAHARQHLPRHLVGPAARAGADVLRRRCDQDRLGVRLLAPVHAAEPAHADQPGPARAAGRGRKQGRDLPHDRRQHRRPLPPSGFQRGAYETRARPPLLPGRPEHRLRRRASLRWPTKSRWTTRRPR